MYSGRAIDLFARVQGAVRPGRPAQPGHARPPRPGRRQPAARRCRAAAPTGLASATPHDGGDFTTAVHRCVGVGKCRADTTASGGVMCPSFLATRDEKDSTRGRARVLQEMATARWSGRLARAGGARRARPVPVLQGLLVATARPASTWPPTRPRCCTSATGGGCARRRTTRWAGCRAGPAGRPAPRLANAVARRAGRRRGSRGGRAGGIDPRRALPRVRAAHLPSPAWRRAGRGAGAGDGRARWCCGPTRSPTASPRGRAGGRRGAAKTPATRCSVPDGPPAAG